MNKAEQKKILILARKAVQHFLDHDELLRPEESDYLFACEHLGCFITLKTLNNELRGCIGIIEADRPLYKNIIQYAVHAATRDPRFPPITHEELSKTHFEISVLGPVIQKENFDEIKVGRDGLIIQNPQGQGLLLPQVATEWKLNTTQFLEQTSLKAGLSKDAYNWPDSSVFTFTAEVFGKESHSEEE